ncbi:DUF1643 domain-containing protein [Gelidibacter gilvus]|uniref:DUF1643 domain-containing protein n=1 Tax=Gelidibacter gilvus TaxID=59602 RepID=A0A4Q0XKQ8_9FLAO|nr:DUF1643 domain-containing protein [Gelidibacter gilvus]RXJ51092.1 DUF1643 domain-containing protein [Gelidibacter gilvus]
MEAKFLCDAENDQRNRFVLAKKGKKNLLVICLNPNTANEYEHDETSLTVEKIAIANGYDGWVLINLTPERTNDEEFLSSYFSEKLLDDNLCLIGAIMMGNQFEIKEVMVAWGDNITIPVVGFHYLRSSAINILDRLKKYELNYWCINLTAKGHPYHPVSYGYNSYLSVPEEVVLQPFDVKVYLKKLTLKYI